MKLLNNPRVSQLAAAVHRYYSGLDPEVVSAHLAQLVNWTDEQRVEHLRMCLQQNGHFDANETPWLEREITHLRARLVEVQYAALRALNFVPLATDIPAWQDTYTYKVMDRTGRAKAIAAGVTDLPRVDVFGTEVTGKVRTFGDSYGWTLPEMRQAAAIGQPLSQQKANAARMVLETAIDECLAFGDLESAGQSGLLITGLINNPHIEAMGISALTNWTMATAPLTILAELNAWVVAVVNNSLQTFLPDTMLLATPRFNIIASMHMSADNDKTVLRSFLDNNPYIKNVDQWHRLNGAGVSDKDRGLVYVRDPVVLEGVLPVAFEQLPPEVRTLMTIIGCIARCGGVKVYHPLGCKYGDFG